MILPTIHLNGTSRQMLIEDYSRAYEAAKKAIEAFRQIEFNARDYYVQDAGAWSAARDQRAEMLQHLYSFQGYLEAHLIHLHP